MYLDFEFLGLLGIRHHQKFILIFGDLHVLYMHVMVTVKPHYNSDDI